jgi:hypothetical protein
LTICQRKRKIDRSGPIDLPSTIWRHAAHAPSRNTWASLRSDRENQMVKIVATKTDRKTSKEGLGRRARDVGGEIREKHSNTMVNKLSTKHVEASATGHKREASPSDMLIRNVEHGVVIRAPNVRFGSVTVKGPVPDAETVKRNVASGQSALKRALAALSKPGIKLPRNKGVPLYRADPEDPTILIRELNGREERGTLADGEFKTSK